MSDGTQDLDFGPDELRARAAVQGLGVVAADEKFRLGLRESFVSGQFDVRARRLRAAIPSRRPRLARVVPLLAAAAVLVVVLGPLLWGPALNIVAVNGNQQIVLNGELVSCADLSPVQAALQPGCRIRVPDDATVEVAGAWQILMNLQGVEFTFPGRPHWALGGELESAIRGDGIIRMALGPGFEGHEYRLQLGAAELLVREGAFTVSRRGEEIGISVLEGELEARLPDGSIRMVGPQSGAMIRSGAFMPMEFDARETERLELLRARAIVS